MPLSFGHFDGSTIECCYHGWQFDCKSGECKSIPSLTADSKLKIDRIFATHFRCEERDGYAWVYIPDGEDIGAADEAIPNVPVLPVHSERFRIAHVSVNLPCDVDQGMLGLLDPAHGPFVHKSWFWKSSRKLLEKQKTYEPIPNGFRMIAHTPSTNNVAYKLLKLGRDPVTTQIDIVLPNIRVEEVRCGSYWFTNRTMITPIKSDLSRLDFVAAWNLLDWVPFVREIFLVFARRFIKQDEQVMTKLAVGFAHNPPLMLIDDADRLVKWYYQLKAAYVDAKSSKMPMVHPLSGQVTLRWRT
jgi:phenylpropionate dioxygenase-like ring-hydroxylating dioxygenase large terminal subunit